MRRSTVMLQLGATLTPKLSEQGASLAQQFQAVVREKPDLTFAEWLVACKVLRPDQAAALAAAFADQQFVCSECGRGCHGQQIPRGGDELRCPHCGDFGLKFATPRSADTRHRVGPLPTVTAPPSPPTPVTNLEDVFQVPPPVPISATLPTIEPPIPELVALPEAVPVAAPQAAIDTTPANPERITLQDLQLEKLDSSGVLPVASRISTNSPQVGSEPELPLRPKAKRSSLATTPVGKPVRPKSGANAAATELLTRTPVTEPIPTSTSITAMAIVIVGGIAIVASVVIAVLALNPFAANTAITSTAGSASGSTAVTTVNANRPLQHHPDPTDPSHGAPRTQLSTLSAALAQFQNDSVSADKPNALARCTAGYELWKQIDLVYRQSLTQPADVHAPFKQLFEVATDIVARLYIEYVLSEVRARLLRWDDVGARQLYERVVRGELPSLFPVPLLMTPHPAIAKFRQDAYALIVADEQNREGYAAYGRGDFKTAATHYTAAVESWPELLSGWQNLTEAYMATRQWERAERAATEGLKLFAEGYLMMLYRGIAATQRGAHESAERDLQGALTHYRKVQDKALVDRIHHASGCVQLAIIRMRNNQLAAARELLAEALRQAPDYLDARLVRIEVDVWEGEFAKAKADLESFAPKIEPLAKLYELRALTSLGLGDLPMAETAIAKALDLPSASWETHAVVACVKARKGDVAGARQALDRAQMLVPPYDRAKLDRYRSRLELNR